MVNENTKEVRFTLRIMQELYEIVKQSAFDNKRSIAKEIEFILEQNLKKKRK